AHGREVQRPGKPRRGGDADDRPAVESRADAPRVYVHECQDLVAALAEGAAPALGHEPPTPQYDRPGTHRTLLQRLDLQRLEAFGGVTWGRTRQARRAVAPAH